MCRRREEDRARWKLAVEAAQRDGSADLQAERHALTSMTARYEHADTASLARDRRLHRTFSAPAGAVVSIATAQGLNREVSAGCSERGK